MLSQSIQDYVKTIYHLQANGIVSTTELSKELKKTGASVTGMLKKLDGMGLVVYNSYKGVKLSPTGEKIALEIIRHHRLLELYLREIMGYSIEKVHNEACRLEHHISEEFGDKIDNLLGNPKYDPHGHPIPTKDGKIDFSNYITLYEVEASSTVKIIRLSDHDNELLAYFEKINLLPGIILKVTEKESLNKLIKIMVNDKEINLGNDIAKNIYVELVPEW